jgi:predicted dehydrogenase
MLSARAFVTWSRGEDYYSDDWHGTIEKECGGVLINQSIHTLDLIEHLCGKCRKVTAHVSNDHLKGIIEVEDNASGLMELENGITAMMYATTAYAENSDVLIDITLEKGKLRIEGEKLCIQNGGGFTDVTKKNESVYHGQSYWGTGHGALINDFYDCLKSGRKFAIDAYEGSVAARAVFAAYKSSESGLNIEL